MASNNLAVGAEALLRAGVDPNYTGSCGATPMEFAQQARARDVVAVLQQYSKGQQRKSQIRISSSSVEEVNQDYLERTPDVIPVGFSLTCAEMGWDTEKMWLQLSNQKSPWYEAENGSYIYWNQNDGQWWIDAPDGKGIFVARAAPSSVPSAGWKPIA